MATLLPSTRQGSMTEEKLSGKKGAINYSQNIFYCKFNQNIRPMNILIKAFPRALLLVRETFRIEKQRVEIKRILKKLQHTIFLSKKAVVALKTINRQTLRQKVQLKIVIKENKYNFAGKQNPSNFNEFLYSGKKKLKM